ncbi:MAG: hypothetical protein M3Y86_10535, partial [Verrucomicrobiota bacterium]|nr:hypothetical protein [Verrucomicrobiota bacterium]
MISLAETNVPITTAVQASSEEIMGRQLRITGRALRVATIQDEEWIEGAPLDEPGSFLAEMQARSVRADLFSFAEPTGRLTPRFPRYHLEWDNAAVVPLTTFQDWWENRVPQETRKNVRRSQRRGVTVHDVAFDDALVHAIKTIYDETPLRQGRRFWHYG